MHHAALLGRVFASVLCLSGAAARPDTLHLTLFPPIDVYIIELSVRDINMTPFKPNSSTYSVIVYQSIHFNQQSTESLFPSPLFLSHRCCFLFSLGLLSGVPVSGPRDSRHDVAPWLVAAKVRDCRRFQLLLNIFFLLPRIGNWFFPFLSICVFHLSSPSPPYPLQGFTRFICIGLSYCDPICLIFPSPWHTF